jgi:hypothetical protein
MAMTEGRKSRGNLRLSALPCGCSALSAALIAVQQCDRHRGTGSRVARWTLRPFVFIVAAGQPGSTLAQVKMGGRHYPAN